MARGDRENALRRAVGELGFTPGKGPALPRIPGLPEPAASWVLETYRLLGGMQAEPHLRPRGWDIPTARGLVVELDEEQHFTRYRALTLDAGWMSGLPWRDDYVGFCARFEPVALRSHSGGGFWQSSGSIAQFGPAGPRGILDGAGSPRWRQRALYDAMRDAVAAAGGVRLARVSVYDEVAGVRLGDALRGLGRLDLDALAELIVRRTAG